MENHLPYTEEEVRRLHKEYKIAEYLKSQFIKAEKPVSDKAGHPVNDGLKQ